MVSLNRSVLVLISKVQDYVYSYNLGLPEHLPLHSTLERDLPGLRSAGEPVDGMYEILLLQQKIVLQVVDRLKLCSHRCEYTPNKPLLDMRRVLLHLEQAFSKLSQLTLRRELKFLVDTLGSENPVLVVDALRSLVELGNQQSAGVAATLSDLRTLEYLVGLCRSSASRDTLLLGLRSISSICCTVECIRSLEAAGGISLISKLLVSGPSLEVRVEAAGVLAQITSPWISDNHSVAGLQDHLPGIVLQLSTLSSLQCGEDSFLLVSAALANLTLMQPGCMDAMVLHSTSRILSKRVQSSPFISVFARDQVVTVLASLAGHQQSRPSILQQGGMEFLVSHLNISLEGVEPGPETSAHERVLKKSAIALCRLCLGAEECRMLETLGGVDRAVELCRDPWTRNYSDAVLVACLALLKRVQPHLTKQIDNSLTKDNLMDSFKELANKHTSYV